MPKKTAKIVAISCTHAPFTPPETLQWILEQLTTIDGVTHLVHLGDLHDGTAASVHPSEASHSLSDEYESSSNFLRTLRAEIPSSTKLVCCLGNHDANILAEDPRRIDRAVRNLVDWRKHPEFGDEFKRWHWLPYEKSARCVYRVGQVHLFHGFDAGVHGDEIEGVQMVGACGWTPYALTIRGHTHRPVSPTRARRSSKCMLPYWNMNVGTCVPLKPAYMARKDTSLWNAGMAIVETVWDKPSRISGKSWAAELREMPR